MSKNVFVSYKFSEKNWKDNGLQFFQKYPGGKSQATPVTIEEGDIQGATNAKIEAKISELLKKSAGLLVVIGNNSQHSDWVTYEVGVAVELKLKCAYTRHPNATGGVPKIIADRENARENPIKQLAWDQDEIAKWVNAL